MAGKKKKTTKKSKKKGTKKKPLKKITKGIGKAASAVFHIPSSLFSELNKFEDNTGIPMKLIVGVLTGGVTPRSVTHAVETFVRSGKKKRKTFTLTKTTKDLISQFKKEKNFPYKGGYKRITWYYHNPKINGAMTFENRIYFQQEKKPDQNEMKTLQFIIHEMIHTHQYYRYGLRVFILTYVGNWFYNLIFKHRKDAYREIEFEYEAYQWDLKFCKWLQLVYPGKFKNCPCDYSYDYTTGRYV